MRCFIAIDIDASVKASLAEVQDRLARDAGLRPGDVKWVRPEAMHLTLRFLGEVHDAQVSDLCRALASTVQRHRRFDLLVAGLGYYGGDRARVLWAGVTTGHEALQALHADLETELEGIGWAKEGRRFSDHLTLCRIKRPSVGPKLIQAAAPYRDSTYGETGIESVTLYESILKREGPTYTALTRCPLQETL